MFGAEEGVDDTTGGAVVELASPGTLSVAGGSVAGGSGSEEGVPGASVLVGVSGSGGARVGTVAVAPHSSSELSLGQQPLLVQ